MTTRGRAIVSGLAAGVPLGLASAALMIFMPSPLGTTSAGSWQRLSDPAGAATTPWQTAHIALTGVFALFPSEAVYFVAERDASGQPLTGRCRYRVSGTIPRGGWASLTAYGDDLFLIANPQRRYSVRLQPGAAMVPLAVAADAPADGLPVAPDRPFSLMLRVYEPDAALLRDAEPSALPTITRAGCTR